MKVEEFFRADENGVSFCTLREEKRYTYDEFILRLQSKKISSPILPHGTIWFEQNGVEKLHAIQIPPKKRIVPYYDKFYEIGFPSFILLVKTAGSFVVNVALCVAKKPIQDFDDDLFRLPLPNMDDRGVLCLGHRFDTESSKMTAEIERIRKVVEHVETSKYNNHLLPLTKWIPPEICGSDYEYEDQFNTEQNVSVAQRRYNDVLKRWAELTKGSNWFKAVEKIDWRNFKKFHAFVQGNF